MFDHLTVCKQMKRFIESLEIHLNTWNYLTLLTYVYK